MHCSFKGPALALLGCILVYSLGLPGGFLIDDMTSVLPAHLASFSLSELLHISTQNTSGPLGRPITVGTFALTDLMFGPHALAYKVGNIVLHLVTGVLLYIFLRRIFSAVDTNRDKARWISLGASSLWLLHPLQVSTVLYIVQRMTQLSAIFVLLGLIGYLHYRKQLSHKTPGSLIKLICCYVICLTLGVLSKESAVLLAPFILLTEFILSGRFGVRSKGLWAFFGLLIVIPAVLGTAYLVLHWSAFMARYEGYPFTLSERLMTQPSVLWLYLQLLCLPMLHRFGLFQDDFPITQSLAQVQWSVVGMLGVVIVGCFVSYRRYPIASFGALWFFTGHLLESTFWPLEMAFEHRNYVPSMGVLLLIPLGLHCLIELGALRKSLATFILVLIVVSMSGLTAIRASNWSNNIRLLTVSSLYHPDSPRVHAELGRQLELEGFSDAALAEIGKTAILLPDSPGPRLHLILLHCSRVAIEDDLHARTVQMIAEQPLNPYTLQGLSTLSIRMLRKDCPTTTPGDFRRLAQAALGHRDDDILPLWRSLLHLFSARSAYVDQQYDLAWEQYDAAFDLYPQQLDILIEKLRFQVDAGQRAAGRASLKQLEGLTAGHLIRYDFEISQLRQRLHEN